MTASDCFDLIWVFGISEDSTVPPINYFCNRNESNLVCGVWLKIVNSIAHGGSFVFQSDFGLFEINIGSKLSLRGPLLRSPRAFLWPTTRSPQPPPNNLVSMTMSVSVMEALIGHGGYGRDDDRRRSASLCDAKRRREPGAPRVGCGSDSRAASRRPFFIDCQLQGCFMLVQGCRCDGAK